MAVGPQLPEEINSTSPAGVDDSDYSIDSNFYLRSVTREELFRSVLSMWGRSVPVCDIIPVQIIKDDLPNLSDPLLHIVNLSVRI